MKNKNYYLLTAMAVLFSFSLFAQTEEERAKIIANYDLGLLKQMEIEAAENYLKEKQEAIEAAERNGWPVSYEKEGGGRGEIMRILPDGTPIYYETDNKNGTITIRADRLHPGGDSGLDLDGEEMLVGVWDGGAPRGTHELFEGRTTYMEGGSGFDNHATHVTGTIIGTGEVQSGNAIGTAPAASSINYNFNNALSEIIAATPEYGLLVSNHSYGVPADGGNGPALPVIWLGKYEGEARAWDSFLYSSPYMLMVKSAGNARNTAHNNQGDGGFDLLTTNANSKNNLVVAATWQVLNYTGPSSVPMSPFSSWGPTDDGRVKPDISAKGVNVFSAVAASDTSYNGNYSGTSMSAPSVSGAALLLQQHYNNEKGEFMRSSTLRGLIIHTANEAGLHPGPDYRFGWGLMNTERAAEVISNDGVTSYISEVPVEDGSGFTITGTAVPGERLVASITWTDMPGAVNNGGIDDDTPALVNDFDIRVTDSDGEVFYPWILDHHNFAAAATTGDNYRDNVEKIEIDNPEGIYTINVSHKGSLVGNMVVSIIISGIQDATLGSPDNHLARISVFPNPASDVLNIHAGEQISHIEIMNMLGQSMGVYKADSNTTQLNISDLKTGAYFVRVTIDNASKVYKFLKK